MTTNYSWRRVELNTQGQKPDIHKPTEFVKGFTGRSCTSFTKLPFARSFIPLLKPFRPTWMYGLTNSIHNALIKENTAMAEHQCKHFLTDVKFGMKRFRC